MATQVYFDGKMRVLPGAYATITSGEQNAPANLDYGRILIIDTGLGAGWGGGSGVAGALKTGKDSVYQFDNIDDYKSFLKGGLLWKTAEALFFPYNNDKGVSRIYHVKAAETAAASMTFVATGGGAAGGTFKINCRDEGLASNGTLTTTHLDKGFAYTIQAGVLDTAKFIFKIWRGTWVGDHTDGIAYNEITKAASVAELVIQSPEFNNINELITWATQSVQFNSQFALDATSAAVGTGAVNSADVSGSANYVAATGGTETYSSTHLDTVFEAVGDLDYQFVLCDKYGVSDYNNALVTKIFTHVKDSGTQFIKTMVIGGGQSEAQFKATGGSIDIAKYFNSNRAIVVHGAVKTTTQINGAGFRTWPSLYHAAVILGKICGLPPQVPLTNKQIGIAGLTHNIIKRDLEAGLDYGVLMTVADQFRGGFKVLQGINSLQDNRLLFNSLGQSHSIQFERIVAQINRELIVKSEIDLLGNPNGVNASTLSPGILKTWTETYLQTRVATSDVDNLLISFRNVTVTRVDDYYKVTYGIVINNEITKIFFTGFLFKQ
jgi:hypothetical protein